MNSAPNPPRFFTFRPLLAIVGIALVVVVAGASFLRDELTGGRLTAQRQLQAIGQLKTRELQNWRAERLSEARFLHRTPAVVADATAVLNNPADSSAEARLRGWLDTIKGGNRYESVLLFDARAQLLVAVSDTAAANLPLPAAEFAKALNQPEVSMGDLAHLGPQRKLFLDLVVPIRPAGSLPTAPALGIIVLRINPEHFLFPTIQTWPLESASAETILVRREDAVVVFLNVLRHRPDPALTIRLPLTDPRFSAARAARGEFGIFEGVDYRGVGVLSSIHPIPHSPWILIAEIDVEEVYGPIRSSAWKTGALVGLVLLAVTLFIVGTWRRRHTAYLNRVLAAEVQRNTIAERLALITQHVNDAIFLFDDEARIIEANEYARTLYGRTLGELRQLRAADLRDPESAASAPADFAQALTPAGIRFETHHRRADGTLFPVEANAKLVVIDGRRHVLSIVRDITERRIQEQEIERLNRIYLVLSLLNQAIVRTRQRQELLDRVCTILVEAGGFKIAWLGWLDPQSNVLRPVAVAGDTHGYVPTLGISSDPALAAGRGPSGTAFREGRVYVCNDFHRDPATLPWREAAARSGIAASITLPVRFEGKPAGLLTAYAGTANYFGHREIPLMEQIAGDVSFALDVLSGEERHRAAESALRESENRLKFLVTSTPAVIYSLRPRGDYGTTFISSNVTELLGHRPDDFLSDPAFWLAHLHPDDVPRATAEFAHLPGAGKIVREYRFRHRNGSYRWMHDEVRVVLDARGEPQDLVGYWFDITPRKTAEENLRKLSRIVEQAPLSIAITDLYGTITYVNPKFLEVSGYTNDEVLGRNPRVLKSGQTPASVYTGMWATLTRGQVWQGELCNRRKNGELYFENAVIAPVVDEAGCPTHYVALKEDITETKRTADALREVQNRYRLIAENTADVIWLYDLAANRFTYCSPSVRNLLGYSGEQILGQTMAQILSPDSAAYVAAALPQRLAAYAQGDASTLTWTDEVGQVRRDGSVVPTEVVTTLLPDAAGRVTQIIGVTRDVTERVKARAALQRFNTELESKVTDRTAELAQRNRDIQALLQSIPDTVLHLRNDGTVLYKQVAPGAPDLQVPGDSVSPFHAAPSLLSPSLAIGRRAIAEGTTVSTEAEISLPGGPVTLELRATPSGPDAVVVVARDITARKRLEIETAAMLEKERQVSEMKTRFISVTSHEFRTPMAAALGSVELLHNHLERLGPAKREELFGRITTSMHRLTEMLDDVLTLNRMDANRIDMRLATSDLRLFLLNAVEEIRLADHNEHELVLRLEPDAPTPSVTDTNLLHHIVSNLLSNAVRYSPPGKTITVTLTAGDSHLRLTVEDQGIGIPASDHARIFQPFERASNVGNIKGTGLGLSIVKRMTEMLGGTITLASPPTGGCSFTLTLPHLAQPPSPS